MNAFDQRFFTHPLAGEVLHQVTQFLGATAHSLTVTEMMTQWSRLNALNPDTFDACMRMASSADGHQRFLGVLETMVQIQRAKDSAKMTGHEVDFNFDQLGASLAEGPVVRVTCILRPTADAALVQQQLRGEGEPS